MTTYPTRRPIRSTVLPVLRGAARGALLLPRGALALAGTAAARPGFATRMLRPDAPADPSRTGAPRRLWYGLVAVLLGALALVPVGVELLFLLRGVAYGLVDHGPYDHSWGGPTMAGAWAAHFAIALPFAALGLVVLAGLDALHRRVTAPMVGRTTPAWTVPVVVLAVAAAALLVRAWLAQL